VRSVVLARRVAHGLGGALAGTLVATCLAQAGLAFADPYALLAAFTLAGGAAAFVGVEIGGRKTDSAAVLSVAGTLAANATALAAALLIVLEAPARTGSGMMIGFWWVFGIAAQAAAGVLARVRALDPDKV
jgi:hypothetical protein